jgi:hypothetical protein
MIAETPSNPSSSRSHCLFIITISSRKSGHDVIRRSKLHLVDLAGLDIDLIIGPKELEEQELMECCLKKPNTLIFHCII